VRRWEQIGQAQPDYIIMTSSVLHQTYYALKPFLPKRLRYAARGALARRKRFQASEIWPVLPGSEKPPQEWPGWPTGKRFAFVLTHDVEGAHGVAQCRLLAELEMQLGFRSSFNFVPAGEYRVPDELRAWLSANGFEVGVHDHRHDGKLYSSRRAFVRGAEVINAHLKQWNAVGFRAGFMFHNLDWQRDLNVLYDASTFDTDPFEPQPDGVGTIFPFWVPAGNGRNGYAELPYTLPQDSTLFFILRERTIGIWKRKLDWVAKAGGMCLLNVHPDYLAFEGSLGPAGSAYPSLFYRELLEYVRSTYQGQYWHCLPREAAEFVSNHRNVLCPPEKTFASVRGAQTQRGKIWIDLDNTPHVPFFKPVIRELQRRGHKVLLTARDAFQVWQLVEKEKLPCRKVGKHYGKHPLNKLAGLAIRSAQLLPMVLRDKPDLALSLGARSQMLLANALHIPTMEITDYEHAKWAPLARPTRILACNAIPRESFGTLSGRVQHYTGLKEDVYAPDFQADPAICTELGLNANEVVVTVRPPANEAHYHNPESDQLFAKLMNRLSEMQGVKVVLLPRNRRQEAAIRNQSPAWFSNGKTVVPPRAVDGLNLIWFSDVVVSGGGTMNREAAALGVPVYSLFRGRLGAVDQRLVEEGRLTLIQSEAEVESKILIRRRDKSSPASIPRSPALLQVVEHVESMLREARRSE
jgi:predicted glycosyltransferase